MAATKGEAAARDRSRTEAAILDGAKRVLTEQGFGAFGPNAIARAAGCDKQLIYRYFGGVEGLADALGRELAATLEAELPLPDPAVVTSYGAFVEHLVIGLLAAFRRSSLLLRLMTWELLAPSELARRVARSRGAALAAWVEANRGDLRPPGTADVGAVNATLIAAVQHLALSAEIVGGFGGVALRSEEEWNRIETVVRLFVRSAYAPCAPG